jgi:peptide/nickel transport system permease protein
MLGGPSLTKQGVIVLKFIAGRLLLFIPTLIAISIVTFVLIQLPPGDYVSSHLMRLEQAGQEVTEELAMALRQRYGMDQPIVMRYFRWIGNIVLRGDFGHSMQWNRPVSDLIWERIGWTVAISLATMLFTWVVAFPIGVYSATRQYSIFDYGFTFIGFIGQSIPDFLIALVFMWAGYRWFGLELGGLFSEPFREAPWSWAKFMDLLSHLWVPMIVLGTAGTAGLIRTLRANLLDEVRKPYVVTARAKGLPERRVIWKYPVRVAINPFISATAYMLPGLISGATIVSVVLSLPTTGPMQLRALMSQDMYLAGSFLLILSSLTLLGTLISDILLAWVDPRIRVDR